MISFELNSDPLSANVSAKSPIEDICPYELRQGFKFDFIVLFDNSCGLSADNCDRFLEGVGEIIGTLSDKSDKTRVQTMQFESKGAPSILVDFGNKALQRNPYEYARYIRHNGHCTAGGQGKTDLAKGVPFVCTLKQLRNVFIVAKL